MARTPPPPRSPARRHGQGPSSIQHLGERIRTARRSRGLHQVDLARLAGVSRETIIKIEAGRNVESWLLGHVLDALEIFATRSRE
jgi:DNA-binding XRE family transcriptional regulator